MSAELRVPCDPAFVSLARLVVAQAARLAGVPQERVQDVKIAVAEAFTSAIAGRDGEGVEGSLELRFGSTPAGFEVVVSGVGHPPESRDIAGDLFDPELSFTLIEGLTDEFSHVADGDGMRLRFVVAAA